MSQNGEEKVEDFSVSYFHIVVFFYLFRLQTIQFSFEFTKYFYDKYILIIYILLEIYVICVLVRK